jgi:hypothetical protein
MSKQRIDFTHALLDMYQRLGNLPYSVRTLALERKPLAFSGFTLALLDFTHALLDISAAGEPAVLSSHPRLRTEAASAFSAQRSAHLVRRFSAVDVSGVSVCVGVCGVWVCVVGACACACGGKISRSKSLSVAIFPFKVAGAA